MLDQIASFFSTFWVVFSFSFLVALTGAMSPGPLLTYTIIESVKAGRRGYLMGLWVITGHAILEMGIIILLLLGFSFILQNIVVVRTIGILGGLILIFFGATIVRDVCRGRISTRFLETSESGLTDSHKARKKKLDNPVVGGFMVSMSNPYWWVWWATIGFAFMVQFEISFKEFPRLFAFFLGHEAGDLIWYMIVSTLAYFGLRRLNRKAYYGILVCCAIFMMLFGVYLGVSPFLRQGV